MSDGHFARRKRSALAWMRDGSSSPLDGLTRLTPCASNAKASAGSPAPSQWPAPELLQRLAIFAVAIEQPRHAEAPAGRRSYASGFRRRRAWLRSISARRRIVGSIAPTIALGHPIL